MVSSITALAGLALIAIVLVDCFETMLLPRRVSHNFRLARQFYLATWRPWSWLGRRMDAGKRRELFLSVFGPLSILALFALWALALIVGFALLQWSFGPTHGGKSLSDELYMSGVTFFTLGYGDLTPSTTLGRVVAVAEAGLGFGFLAVVISYLPVLYQAFSKREVTISLLDARAGSPPTAAQFLIRSVSDREGDDMIRMLGEWERWSAELLESHLSFPVLSFYRSQHDNQSWLAAVTAILDACSLLNTVVDVETGRQPSLTFAMARHAVVDLTQAYKLIPREPAVDRLSAERMGRLREALRGVGLKLREGEAVDRKVRELRGMYEPFVESLSDYFLLPLPRILADEPTTDNWQTSAWMRRTGGITTLSPADSVDDHEV